MKVDHLLYEAEILDQLKHPNIIKYDSTAQHSTAAQSMS
jgi:hypothetical protein